jgi:hypothetical protein
MKPDTSPDTSWTWLQMAQGLKHEAVKLQGPEQKMLKLAGQGALSKPCRRQRQGPTWRREQVSNWLRSIGERNGAKPGLGWSAQAGRPGLFQARLAPPLTYVFVYLLPLPLSAATSIHSLESRRDEGEAPGGSRRPLQVLEFPRRWLRLNHNHHSWPYVVKLWSSFGAVSWIHQGTCTFDGDINLILSPDLFWCMPSLIHVCI